jgi:hypothetical protein
MTFRCRVGTDKVESFCFLGDVFSRQALVLFHDCRNQYLYVLYIADPPIGFNVIIGIFQEIQ